MSLPSHHDVKQDGGSTLRHGAVAIAVADGIVQIRPACATRRRIQMFNATAIGTGSTVYVGAATDVDGADLAAANGWPLNETAIAPGEGWKVLANVLELFTKAAI